MKADSQYCRRQKINRRHTDNRRQEGRQHELLETVKRIQSDIRGQAENRGKTDKQKHEQTDNHCRLIAPGRLVIVRLILQTLIMYCN